MTCCCMVSHPIQGVSSEHLPTIIAFTTSVARSTNQEPKDQEWTEVFYSVKYNVCSLKDPWNICIQGSPNKIWDSLSNYPPKYGRIYRYRHLSIIDRFFWSERYQTTNNPHPKLYDTDTADLGETKPSDGEYDLKIKLAVESVFSLTSLHLGVFSKLL